MTVAQLLKSAKTLPKRERERLVREILALEKPSRKNRPSERRMARVTWPDVEARAKLIVGDRVCRISSCSNAARKGTNAHTRVRRQQLSGVVLFG